MENGMMRSDEEIRQDERRDEMREECRKMYRDGVGNVGGVHAFSFGVVSEGFDDSFKARDSMYRLLASCRCASKLLLTSF
jgi:hypothetical protein